MYEAGSRIGPNRHRIHPGRRRSTQPPERSLQRSHVHMVHQRSESGLTRPSGRIVHPQPVRRQAAPALRPVLPPRQRAPLPSGPSLLTTRCLRRHLRDYAPIRHPNAPQATAAVFPRRWPPAVTCRRAHPGFPGSDDLLSVHDVVHDPGASTRHSPSRADRCCLRPRGRPRLAQLHHFVAPYTPCTLAVYASTRPLPARDARLATGRLVRAYPGGTLTRWTSPASPGAHAGGLPAGPEGRRRGWRAASPRRCWSVRWRSTMGRAGAAKGTLGPGRRAGCEACGSVWARWRSFAARHPPTLPDFPTGSRQLSYIREDRAESIFGNRICYGWDGWKEGP